MDFDDTEAIKEAATDMGICNGGPVGPAAGCTLPVGVTVTEPPTAPTEPAAAAAATADPSELFVIVIGSDRVCGGIEEVLGKAKMRLTLPPSDVKYVVVEAFL